MSQDIVTRQLKNSQTKRECNLNNAIGKTYNPKVNIVEASQLKKAFSPNVKETAARQLNNLQPKGQGNCNQAIEELTAQRSI